MRICPLNTKGIKAIKNTECLCWKCLKEHSKDNIHVIHIPSSGYGSQFDNMSTQIQLCDNCYAETNPEWWKFETVPFTDDGMGELFRYDKEISQFIEALPLEGQYMVMNEFAYGACAGYSMDAQDWIDFELGELSHEKCKEYGFISPDEEKAYQERFTTCQYPMNRIYNDGSKGCWCPFGAYGKENQLAGDNVSDECYNCHYYKKRKSPILNISDDDWEDLMMYFHYQINEYRLEQKFSSLQLGL